MFKDIVIVGMGLMGGSLALGIKKYKLARNIIAYDISQEAIDYAIKHKMVTRGSSNISDLAKEAQGANDLIIIAVPLSKTAAVISNIKLAPKTLIIEIGSSKRHLPRIYYKEQENSDLLNLNLVPTHPLAGIEKNGVENSVEDLFTNKKCLVTPFEWNDPNQVAKAVEFWRKLGSVIHYMSVNNHDNVFAYTSHLPHFLAYTIINTTTGKRNSSELFNYGGGGMKDFSRLAASSETMWADIFMYNRNHLLKSIGKFQHELAKMRDMLQSKDRKSISDNIKNAKRVRKLMEDVDNNHASFHEDDSGEIDYIVEPTKKLQGKVQPDPDKSMSHRSIIIGSIAKGMTTINNFLPAADTLNTLSIFKALGVKINHSTNYSTIKIKGTGLDGLKRPNLSLDCGNSGTAARLLTGLLSVQNFSSQLRGDQSLSSRPMGRVIEPLIKMGANIYASEGDRLPLLIMGKRELRPINYKMPIPSAQIKSAIILASLYLKGETTISGGKGSRDHTERMLKNFGYKVNTNKDGSVILEGQQKLNAATVQIPGDISSAAFFIVAASIIPDSNIVLRGVGINPNRIGILKILELMGGKIEINNQQKYGNEPVADISVSYAKLKGINIDKELVALGIDEMPIAMVAAAYAEGTTKISGAEELLVKETDRIAAMVDGLNRIKIKATATKDGVIIQGGKISGGEVDSYKDHRIAMSFAVAACGAQKPIHIKRCANVKTSFPNFVNRAKELGMNLQELPHD